MCFWDSGPAPLFSKCRSLRQGTRGSASLAVGTCRCHVAPGGAQCGGRGAGHIQGRGTWTAQTWTSESSHEGLDVTGMKLLLPLGISMHFITRRPGNHGGQQVLRASLSSSCPFLSHSLWVPLGTCEVVRAPGVPETGDVAAWAYSDISSRCSARAGSQSPSRPSWAWVPLRCWAFRPASVPFSPLPACGP